MHNALKGKVRSEHKPREREQPDEFEEDEGSDEDMPEIALVESMTAVSKKISDEIRVWQTGGLSTEDSKAISK